MRCSFSEARLDAYVEGTLVARDRARVAAHVAGCAACAALLDEFRVIDALLVTPRTLEPAPNFTFKVMAEVRSMHAPRAHRSPTFAVLGAYVVFAWIALGAFATFARGDVRAALAWLQVRLDRIASTAGAVAHATGHVFGSHAFDVTAAMSALLAVDALAAAAIFALYAVLRTRRAAVESDPC
jgi:anti-sigma factor RsiW